MKNKHIIALLAHAQLNGTYTGDSLHHLLERWFKRESNFTFLESIEGVSEPQEPLALCEALSRAERLAEDVERLQEARAAEGRSPLPEALCGVARTLDELTLMEELFDENVIQVTDATEANLCLSGVRALSEALYQSARALLMGEGSQPTRGLEGLEGLEGRDEREGQEEREGEGAEEGGGQPWVLDLPLRRSPLRRAGRWRAVWGEGALAELLGRAREGVDEGALFEAWIKGAPAREQGHLSWREVWREHLAPAAPELALSALRGDLERAVFEDVADEFERLAGVVFWGERWEQVTVMFSKRDGQLLAQRDLTWDPTRPEGAVEAFESIKIRTLVVPCELPPELLPAVEALTARYEIARVSSVGTVEVTRPVNLTPEAQRAWQLAQRFSAPLRFWARAHISDLAREALPQELHAIALGTPEREERLASRVRCRSDARWLELRRRRLERGARFMDEGADLDRGGERPHERGWERPHERPHERRPERRVSERSVSERSVRGDEPAGRQGGERRWADSRRPEGHMANPTPAAGRVGGSLRRGDEVEVTLTGVEPYRLRARRPEDGREALISLSGALVGQGAFREGDRVRAYVLHDHPSSAHLSLTLRPLRGEGAGEGAREGAREGASVSERESLSRLNALFQPRR